MITLHYLKIALRTLCRNKARSLINLLGLAIGFTAFVLGNYWLHWETHFDDFHPQAHRIYAITTTGIRQSTAGVPEELNQLHESDARYFATSIPEIERCSFVTPTYFALEQAHYAGAWSGYQADSSFFAIFRPTFLSGSYRANPFDFSSVVLTKKSALRYFHTVDCAGKTINLGSTAQEDIRTVAGVIDDYPGNTSLSFDLLVLSPSTVNSAKRATVFVLLQKNARAKDVRAKVEAHSSRAEDVHESMHPERWEMHLRSLPEVHLKCNPELNYRFRNIHILALAGLLAFLCALMNHLVLFIGMQQRRQTGNLSHVSVGASRWSLMGKGLIELALPLAVAFVVSLCLIEILYPVYAGFTSFKQSVFSSTYLQTIDKEVLMAKSFYYMGVSMVLFLTVSLVPVAKVCAVEFRSTRLSATNPLSQSLLRQFLIGGQIFISSLFFLTSLSLYKQLYFLKYSNKGLSIERVIQLNLGYETSQASDYGPLKAALLRSPSIEDVTLTVEPVLFENGVGFYNNVGAVLIEGRDIDRFKRGEEEDIIFYVDRNFFSFFGMTLLEGEWLSEATPFDYIVNETGARKMGLPNLLSRPALTMIDGQPLGSNCGKVAGIMADYHYSPLQYPVEKLFFHLLGPEEEREFTRFQYLYIRYLPGKKQEALAHIRSVIQPYDKGEINESRKIIDLPQFEKAFNRPEETLFVIFGTLAWVCILISSFGIYSLVSLSAEQRRKEIAIRKVNGATFRNILHLFFKEYLLIVCLANAAALPLGYVLVNRWLETYAYRTTLSWWLFLLVFVATGLIVMASIFKQISQAARNNPAEAIKSE